jgi:uncharacterized membrane protein HdeD (DUF308 family)
LVGIPYLNEARRHLSLPGYKTMNTTLFDQLANNWGLILLRGLAAILFGFLARFWPGTTLLFLIVLYGFYALSDGILALLAAVVGGTTGPRWWLVLVGLVGLAAAAATFFYPGLTGLLLLTFIAMWAIVHGAAEIAGAIYLRKEIDNEWLLILGGAASVLFGVLILMRPGTGALALVWLISLFSIFYGVLQVMFAFRLRQHRHTIA